MATAQPHLSRAASGWRVKRVLDVLGSAIGLVLATPPMTVTALIIHRTMGRPVLFPQTRPGLGGRPFLLYKFRTMTNGYDPEGALLSDAQRLTPIGSTLRRWSLDELPELWNVLKGDMSLVGPRPLLMEYLDLYTDEQMRRHNMRPGLTGLSQISGRNDQSWEDRLALDVWYVDNWSLLLDFKILIRTVAKVFSGDGVSADGAATMPRFEGTSRSA